MNNTSYWDPWIVLKHVHQDGQDIIKSPLIGYDISAGILIMHIIYNPVSVIFNHTGGQYF